LIGRPLGRRIWLRGLYSHRITETYRFLEARRQEGYVLSARGARLRLLQKGTAWAEGASA